MQDFTLWVEFEHVDYSTKWALETESFVTGGEWDRTNEFCNIHVTLADGRRYGINVWTFKYLATSISQDKENGENLGSTYQIPPDLFVRELTRECIEATITDLLKRGNLDEMLNPSIIDSSLAEDGA